MGKKFLVLNFSFAFCILSFAFTGYAKEITVLYTGETHAMLYPCSCPKEPDGGIARRATLIKELKKNNPHTLVLDSGGFFAGGVLDEYTQNSELDMQRTIVNLKAMEMMGYDAVNIGDDEFNFGSEFLKQRINNTSLPFLSANISPFTPYIIKDMQGTKIGVIGVSDAFAMQKAGTSFKFIEPKQAVKKIIEELKKKGVDIIVLLSQLDENEETNLINDIRGIDVVIASRSRMQKEQITKIGTSLVLRSSWQGRRLGKLSLIVENNKITDYKTEELRLSDNIKDDQEIPSILPRCFADINCKKEGFIGSCQNPGSAAANCLFSEPIKINLIIIAPKQSKISITETAINYLKRQFPGITSSYLYYPDAKARKLISDFGINTLPVYLLDKQIEKEKNFLNFRDKVESKGNFYMLKPEVGGISYFLQRKRIEGKLDLFISLYEKDTNNLLDLIKEYNPTIHFLAIEQDKGFDAARGNLEVEEYLRSVCVQEYYPEYFFDYINCRTKNINSSWWQDCAIKLDADKISGCARGKQGAELLKENIALNKEVRVMFGPTYLLDNREIFVTQGVPAREELKKILKK